MQIGNLRFEIGGEEKSEDEDDNEDEEEIGIKTMSGGSENASKRSRRPRSDTAVRRLTPEQRAKVDGWLFDEELSYGEVAARCLKELGVALTACNVDRYCRQEQGGRASMRQSKGGDRSEPALSGGAGYVAMLEGMNQAAQRAARQIEIGNDPRMLAEFAKVLVAARQEANHSLRATTIRQKFEFDAATACLIHQVKMQCIAADESLDDCQRILKIREELFGPNLPE